MSNNRIRKQSQEESPYASSSASALSSQHTPRWRTRSRQLPVQRTLTVSPQGRTSEPDAALHSEGTIVADFDAAQDRARSSVEYSTRGQSQMEFGDSTDARQAAARKAPTHSRSSTLESLDSSPQFTRQANGNRQQASSSPSPCPKYKQYRNFQEELGPTMPCTRRPGSAHRTTSHSRDSRTPLLSQFIWPRAQSMKRSNAMQQDDFGIDARTLRSHHLDNHSVRPSLKSSPWRTGQSGLVSNPALTSPPIRNVSRNLSAVPQIHKSSVQAVFPQQTTQIPPLNLSQRHFRTAAEAHAYLGRPQWQPITKSHGVPQLEMDRLPYVKKIYDALVDIDHVLDEDTWPIDKKRFQADLGVWGTEPRCIEAVAHQVVDTCISIHERGVTGLATRRFPALQTPSPADKKFTFAQRIHMMALLLRHFKFHANHIMQSSFTMQYLARIWSTLSDLPEFQLRWRSVSNAARYRIINILPYQDVPARRMTDHELEHYKMEARMEMMQQQHLRAHAAMETQAAPVQQQLEGEQDDPQAVEGEAITVHLPGSENNEDLFNLDDLFDDNSSIVQDAQAEQIFEDLFGPDTTVEGIDVGYLIEQEQSYNAEEETTNDTSE